MNRKTLITCTLGSALSASLLTAVLMFTLQASADQDAATDGVPRLIPYQGTLEFDGQPVTRTGDQVPTLQFDVFDEEGTRVFRQSLPVEVYNGQFTALLGPSGSDENGDAATLQGVVSAADDLSLQITIVTDPVSGATNVQLANRQRLLISPYAMWARGATNFDVADSLEVGGGASVGGSLRTMGPGHLGSGRPPSGSAQLRLDNNVGSAPTVDFNDFQLVLWTDGNPINTYGIGVNPETFFFNVFRDQRYVWRDGGQELMRLDGGSNTLSVSDNFTLTGTISDPDSQVTVADGLNVTGHTDLDMTLDVDGGVRLNCPSCGSYSGFQGSVDFGTLIIQGRVFSADSNIHLSPPGGNNVHIEDTFRAAGGTTSSAGAGLIVEGGVNVGGDLTVHGQTVNASNAAGLIITCNWNGANSDVERIICGECSDGRDDLRVICRNGVVTRIDIVTP